MHYPTKRMVVLATVCLIPFLAVSARAQSRVVFGATALRTTRVYSDPTDSVTVAVTGAGLSGIRVDATDQFGYFTDIGFIYPLRAVAVADGGPQDVGPTGPAYARLVMDALAGPVFVMPLGALSLIVGPGVHANAVFLVARETDPGDYMSIAFGFGACAAATWRLSGSLEVGAALRLAYDLFEPIRVPRAFGDLGFGGGWTGSFTVGLGIPR